MSRSFGIDIGTAFITIYEGSTGTVTRIRHEGQVIESLNAFLDHHGNDGCCVFTGKAGEEMSQNMGGVYIGEPAAIASMVSAFGQEWFEDGSGQAIDIGASSLTLYTIRGNQIIDIAKNTLCAAGTGLFLEEQAQRLTIDLENPGTVAMDDPPLIASRCTVFAKSDLIHHQQEGRSKHDMWSGLCRSFVISAINTLFRGAEPSGSILIFGGVSLNSEAMRWFKTLYPNVRWIVIPPGEALIAQGACRVPGQPIGTLKRDLCTPKRNFNRMPALTLHRSHYPVMPSPTPDRHQNEIRIHEPFLHLTEIFLGMDIGSTSTKLAVLDATSGKPVLDIYGRTSGDPVGAARKIFASFYDVIGTHDFTVRAFGATGSGRKLVGHIFGADLIVNEISAHARGTSHFFPDVETIFEIGGQDAKYIHLQNGLAADVNMNYVCAAGTGSFVEEQAKKLGFDVRDIGDLTEGIAPPVTSDRCTVFMEQDLRDLLKEGFTKEEALASALYSVIQNYLRRVVGNRPKSDQKIFFQGATARNKGLVGAIENLLGVEVVVSPFCHVMGGVGAALMARDAMDTHEGGEKRVSAFVGRDAVDIRVDSRTASCRLCHNYCRINHISRITGDGKRNTFSWGYQCGRDPNETVRRELPSYALLRERENAFDLKNDRTDERGNGIGQKGTITLIHALTNYTFYPLWVRFFNRLGIAVSISGFTDPKVKKYSSRIASADFCFPVKVALGHMVNALENHSEHPIFFPSMIADKADLKTATSFFCPYVESSASLVRSTLARSGIPVDNLLAPVIDFRLSDRDIAGEIFQTLQPVWDVKKEEVVSAFTVARLFWEALAADLEQKGQDMFEKAIQTDRPVFILIGRPYNLHDHGLNLGIPGKLAFMGAPVIPIDMLPLDTAALSETHYHNVFWKYGQRIMAAIRLAAQYSNVFPVYLSNFNCGPDSFLLSFAESELKGKPMLVLELDEHDSDGGYITRIEAFMDVVEATLKQRSPRPVSRPLPLFRPTHAPDPTGTVWIPCLHRSAAKLFAASFRGFGYACRSMEVEDREALELGKKYLRGGECLPMTLTLGNFLKHLQNEPAGSRHILFMPTAEGPCRFGQYNLLERIIFHRLGLENVDILSPNSINSYQGLSKALRRMLMHAVTASDIVFKMRCKIKPYERTAGDTDALFETVLERLVRALEQRKRPLGIIREAARSFASIPTVDRARERKPLVGIVGEIYARGNPFSNGNLVETIEANGGEAWLTPIHEWFLYVPYILGFTAQKRNANIFQRIHSRTRDIFIFSIAHRYYRAASEILHDRMEPLTEDIIAVGSQYVPWQFQGEAILTLGRAVLFAQQGVDMVINVSPFGCMPGTLSSALLLEIKDKFNIPFLSLFYDGDLGINDKVAALLKTIKT
ncbi:MAG: acyl-CoA dehydratase activase [Candidatus Omnitrophota bacterium]